MDVKALESASSLEDILKILQSFGFVLEALDVHRRKPTRFFWTKEDREPKGEYVAIQTPYGIDFKFTYWKKLDESFRFRWSATSLTESELQAHRQKIEEIEEAERKKKEDAWQVSKAEVEERWKYAELKETHPYLYNKRIKNAYGTKVDKLGFLLIPARDTDGVLWSLQAISEKGEKYNYARAKMCGCFHLIGEINPEGDLAICEGFATAVKFYEQTKIPTVCCFSSNFMPEVAKNLREKYPNVKLILSGDSDQGGRRGAKKAQKAAGGDIFIAKFKSPHPDYTDWADCIEIEGEDSMATQVTEFKNRKKEVEAIEERLDQLVLSTNQKGEPYQNVDNVLRILRGVEDFKRAVWFDSFHQRILTLWPSDRKEPEEWTDKFDIALLVYIQKELGFYKIGIETIRQAVALFAFENERNEPKDWMESLAHDGIERLETFLTTYFGVELNDYSRAVSLNWWTSMIARIYSPGCKVDTMLILEGDQGKAKSKALRAIGGNWFMESHESINKKEFYETLQGKMIVEISELDSFNKADSNKIKQVVSCSSDRYRPSYARRAQDFPRKCIFVGSTNDDNYLKDSTGGRRFWPVKIGNIRLSALEADREQLFAEAVKRYKSGANWYEMPEDATKAEQESRRAADPWEERIASIVSNLQNVTISEISDKLDISPKDRTAFSDSRIRKALKVLKWTPGHSIRRGDRCDNLVVKGWKPPQTGLVEGF